jgi:hypothetical protein
MMIKGNCAVEITSFKFVHATETFTVYMQQKSEIKLHFMILSYGDTSGLDEVQHW